MSSVSWCSRNTRSLPVLACVAPTNNLNGRAARSCAKSTCSASRSRSGLRSNGLSCAGEKCSAQVASSLLAGDRLIASLSPCVTMPTGICWPTAVQKSCNAWRAPSRPPLTQPWASTTAFIAPALLPLRPSKCTRGSASKASSTPQVNAPWAPPPCSARLMRCGGLRRACHHAAIAAPAGAGRAVLASRAAVFSNVWSCHPGFGGHRMPEGDRPNELLRSGQQSTMKGPV